MTEGNTRPLSDGTATEHCMSINNLLRRITVRVNAQPRVLDVRVLTATTQPSIYTSRPQ